MSLLFLAMDVTQAASSFDAPSKGFKRLHARIKPTGRLALACLLCLIQLEPTLREPECGSPMRFTSWLEKLDTVSVFAEVWAMPPDRAEIDSESSTLDSRDFQLQACCFAVTGSTMGLCGHDVNFSKLVRKSVCRLSPAGGSRPWLNCHAFCSSSHCPQLASWQHQAEMLFEHNQG